MKRSIPEKRRRFSNLSLTVKMFLLFSCACLAAMGAAFFISYRQLYVSTRVNQEYLAHQRFEQTQAMLEERLERVESITRMAIGNENLNLCMKQLMESNGFSDQYVQVQSAWEWIKNIYYGTDYDSVILYLDGEYPLRMVYPAMCVIGIVKKAVRYGGSWNKTATVLFGRQ